MSETKDDGPAAKGGGPGPSIMLYPLGTLGAVMGAGLGVLLMYWGLQAGFYAEMLVGIFAGLGAGFLARRGGWTVGVIAGVVALVVGVWAEWKFGWRWDADSSLEYFVRHLTELPRFRMLVHAAGIAVAVWLGARR